MSGWVGGWVGGWVIECVSEQASKWVSTSEWVCEWVKCEWGVSESMGKEWEKSEWMGGWVYEWLSDGQSWNDTSILKIKWPYWIFLLIYCPQAKSYETREMKTDTRSNMMTTITSTNISWGETVVMPGSLFLVYVKKKNIFVFWPKRLLLSSMRGDKNRDMKIRQISLQ